MINYSQVDEVFIRKHITMVDWRLLCVKRKLSESFIREFHMDVDWMCVSIHQVLSIQMMRDFSHMLYWNVISKTQYMDIQFIRDFRSCLVMCDNVRSNVRREHAKLILAECFPECVLRIVISFV